MLMRRLYLSADRSRTAEHADAHPTRYTPAPPHPPFVPPRIQDRRDGIMAIAPQPRAPIPIDKLNMHAQRVVPPPRPPTGRSVVNPHRPTNARSGHDIARPFSAGQYHPVSRSSFPATAATPDSVAPAQPSSINQVITFSSDASRCAVAHTITRLTEVPNECRREYDAFYTEEPAVASSSGHAVGRELRKKLPKETFYNCKGCHNSIKKDNLMRHFLEHKNIPEHKCSWWVRLCFSMQFVGVCVLFAAF